jgi:hypothetical protein
MRIYRSGVYSITTQQASGTPLASGIHGTLRITVTPSVNQAVRLDLQSPQTNRTAFAGTNTVTLSDIYGNPIPPRPVTITPSLPGSVIIANSAGGDNVVDAADFNVNGVANLSAGSLPALAMRYEGLISGPSPAVFTASTTNPLGGSLTHTDTVVMNPGAAFQTTIRGISAPAQQYTNTLTVTAGQPISLSISVQDQDLNLVNSFDPTVALTFTLSPAPTTPASITNASNVMQPIGTATTIDFTGGTSLVAGSGANGQLRIATAGTYSLIVSAPTQHATPLQRALQVTVLPAPATNVRLELQDGQTNDLAFTGTNTVEVLDAFGNRVPNPSGGVSVSLTALNTGTLSTPSHGTGTVTIPAADFVLGAGLVNLTSLGLRYTGNVSAAPVIRASISPSANIDDETVVVNPGAHSGFVVNIAASQTFSTALVGGPTIRAVDISGNTVTTFEADVSNVVVDFAAGVCSAPTVFITGLSGTDRLSSAVDFTNGVASLSALTVRNSAACDGNYRLRFTSGAIVQTTGDILFDSIP